MAQSDYFDLREEQQNECVHDKWFYCPLKTANTSKPETLSRVCFFFKLEI